MIGAVRWIGVVGALLALGAASPGRADEMMAVVGGGNGNGHGDGAYASYPVLEIWKADRRMELREGSVLMRQFRVQLGQQPRDAKRVRGDARTPVGRYYVSEKNPASRFRRFLGLSYPNLDDAERGYRVGLIDAGQWADIFFANLRGETPPAHTTLGGRVGIHGYGGRPYVPIDWTEGCVAVSDPEIDYLFDVVPIGTPVIINE